MCLYESSTRKCYKSLNPLHLKYLMLTSTRQKIMNVPPLHNKKKGIDLNATFALITAIPGNV